MGQWAKVSIAHDGVEFSVAAHNVIEARKADLHEIDAERSGALIIGGFAGLVDDVIYRTAGELEPFDLDPQVNVKLASPLTVRFDVDGRLHERFHEGPVEIPLEHEGRKITVTVDPAGIIR
jgi:hypothetical protein